MCPHFHRNVPPKNGSVSVIRFFRISVYLCESVVPSQTKNPALEKRQGRGTRQTSYRNSVLTDGRGMI
jgi:hypothetical protein